MAKQTPAEFAKAAKMQHIHLEVGEMELQLDEVTRDPRGIMGIRVCVEKKGGKLYRHGFVGRTIGGDFVVLKLVAMEPGAAATVEARGH